MRGWAGLALLVVACGGTPGKEPRSPARVDSSIRAPAKSEKAVACDAEPEALERVDAPDAVSEAFRAQQVRLVESLGQLPDHLRGPSRR